MRIGKATITDHRQFPYLYWPSDTSALRDTLDQPFGRHFNQLLPRRIIGNPKRCTKFGRCLRPSPLQ
jgi:hypothetical protein